jgi:nitrite reductase (NADH) large subunit
MHFYRENARWKECTYTFCERVGLERIHAVVVEDNEGIAADFDVAMQASIDAAYDPWLEALNPKTCRGEANIRLGRIAARFLHHRARGVRR